MTAHEDVLGVLRMQRVVPVIRGASMTAAAEECDAFIAAGYRAVELTLTTPGAVDLIADYGERIHIGAGSVLEPRQMDRAVAAGASFLVSPVTSDWFLPAAAANDVVAVPGAATPTEIFRAVDSGAALVKVFPIARLGGARYIEDLLAPMPELRLMATGGIDARGAAELLTAGCLAVGMGSILSDTDFGAPGARAATALRRCADFSGNG